MPERRIALLRGINVGTAKRIAMADLRKLVEGLGYRDVRTLLNSGNVVFAVPEDSAADPSLEIESAIQKKLGISTRVTVITGSELAEALRANPLRKAAVEPSRLLLMFFREAKAMAAIRPLLELDWKPEALALGKRVAYVWCANGILGGRLWVEVDRRARDVATSRNLATLTKLLALAATTGS